MWQYLLLAFLAAGTGYRSVEIDASRVTGRIHSFQGVANGPLPMAPGDADLTQQYKDLRIDFIREDDLFGPLDIDARWPVPHPLSTAAGASAAKTIFPDWNADPERAESYNFAPTDKFIQPSVALGAEICYRIGRSFAADASPPADFQKYANIVKHVVMHYNQGWAHGFHDHIRYWEFWNEPDAQRSWNPQFVRPFWSGTPQQFYALYEAVATAVKSADPGARIGGPAKAAADVQGPYREGFIRYCAARHVPLDFVSWHQYHKPSSDPYDMVRLGRIWRQLLDAGGFHNTEIIATEWNVGEGISTGHPTAPNMDSAAFCGAALIYLQDSLLAHTAYYRGEAGPRRLFQPNGAYSMNAYAMRATGQMLDTPQRLAVAGADTLGFAVLAGRSEDAGQVRILIANYEIPPEFRGPGVGPMRLQRQPNIAYADNRGYALKIAHLPWGNRPFSVKRFRLNESTLFTSESLPDGTGPAFELNQELRPPAIELLVLQAK